MCANGGMTTELWNSTDKHWIHRIVVRRLDPVVAFDVFYLAEDA